MLASRWLMSVVSSDSTILLETVGCSISTRVCDLNFSGSRRETPYAKIGPLSASPTIRTQWRRIIAR